MKKLSILIAAVVLSVSSVGAQSLKVSTGGSSGTYSKMFKELSGVCINQIPMAEMNSSGSMQNIDRIIGNEANAGFTQTDVMFYRARTEDLSNVKTLVSLHPEEVHLVALTSSKQSEGGTLGFGAKQVQLNSVSDLAGRTVVAAGGSYITAQVIRLQTEINFNVLEVASAELALKAVQDGSAHAAVLVGGAPLPVVAQLDKTFKLLSFSEASMAKLKNVYRPAKLNYSKMGAAGVSTIATDALFVTKEYKTAKYVEGLAKLRQCFTSNVAEMGETIGNHPSWSKIDPKSPGKWAYMELPVFKK